MRPVAWARGPPPKDVTAKTNLKIRRRDFIVFSVITTPKQGFVSLSWLANSAAVEQYFCRRIEPELTLSRGIFREGGIGCRSNLGECSLPPMTIVYILVNKRELTSQTLTATNCWSVPTQVIFRRCGRAVPGRHNGFAQRSCTAILLS